MKLLLYILIPFVSFGQFLNQGQKDFISKNDDAAHFYAVVGVGELSSHTQKILFKDQSLINSLFVDWIVCQLAIFGKETYDCLKANPTGFKGKDIAPGQLGAHVRIMVVFSWDDFKNGKKQPRMINNKKYVLN